MTVSQAKLKRRFLPIIVGFILAMIVVAAGVVWLLTQSPLARSTTRVGVAKQLSSPIAIVNGVAIMPAMVEREVKVSRFNILEPLPPLAGEDLKRAKAEALNQLIIRQLILQAAAAQQFAINKQTIQQRIDLLFGTYGDELLDKALDQSEITRDDLLWWVSELMTVEEFTVKVIMRDAQPEDRQQVYNDWLNERQAQAQVSTFIDNEGQTFAALPGSQAPDFTLNTTTGETLSLSDYQGQIVLLNFWATWCPSCIAELPDYEAVYQQRTADDFIVLAINLQEDISQVQQFAQGLGLTFPILLDEEGQVTIQRYQLIGMPGSLIINREGTIVYRHIGPMSGELLQEKLDALN